MKPKSCYLLPFRHTKPDIKEALGQISQISMDLQEVLSLRGHTSYDPHLETVTLHIFRTQ